MGFRASPTVALFLLISLLTTLSAASRKQPPPRSPPSPRSTRRSPPPSPPPTRPPSPRSPPSPPPSHRYSLPPSPPAGAPSPAGGSTAAGAPASLPLPPPPPAVQYYIHFGKCGHDRQQQQFGNWVMTRSLSGQRGPQSILLTLDTRNMTPVASVFGAVEPLDFPMQNIYFAYFNRSGIMQWSPDLDQTPYRETPTWYTIRVNGVPLQTMRDLKDSGIKTPTTSVYSLKATINGAIYPSATPFRIEIAKVCGVAVNCSRVPDPATVFTSPTGQLVWSIWNVKQTLFVNGLRVQDHAWCPVQSVVDVP